MASFADYQPSMAGADPIDDLVIEEAGEEHAEAIARLYAAREGASSTDAHSWAERLLARRNADVLIASTSGTVVGYGVSAWWEPHDGPAGEYLLGVVVDPSYQRRGVAHALTAARLERLSGRASIVRYVANAGNQATIDLHAHFGFEEAAAVERIGGIEFDGGRGIVFELTLHQPGSPVSFG